MNNWLKFIHSWLTPGFCELCGRPQADSALGLCAGCQSDLPLNIQACPGCALPLPSATQTRCGRCLKKSPAFDRAFSPYLYGPPLAALITGLKFHRQLSSARLLGELFTRQWQQQDLALPECLIPVPLHPERLKQRGYNQALELARPVAHRLGLSLTPHCCQRLRDTKPQTGLSIEQRRANLRRAFSVDSSIPYKHVAVFDDVVTTGHTANALATALRKAGVETVQVWSLARAAPK